MPEDSFYQPDRTPGTSLPASQRRLLLDFSSLSDFVIPKPPLCGRLVTCVVSSRPDEVGQRRTYKVLGFPILLDETDKYERNHFIFNLCFVFEAYVDVQAYEPIVRKCARSLCLLEVCICALILQKEESFVSKLDNLPRLYSIVEQLYEDLNAYYESFVALPETVDSMVDGHDAVMASARSQGNLTLVEPEELDHLIAQALGPLGRVREAHGSLGDPRQNSLRRSSTLAALAESNLSDKSQPPPVDSPKALTNVPERPKREQLHGLGRTVRDAINLKVFPTFMNPAPVHPWDVPVLLLDMSSYVNDGWDLTLVKLLPFLDGTNHVRRISELADTDVALVCQCIEHLLYYSFAIVIDIFQFSNIYMLRPQVARMFDDVQMGNECASYVARPGLHPLPAPTLFRMYSMLRSGRTLHEWVDLVGHYAQSIDIRRFITFGVIKGFVRRVHRYPVLMSSDEAVDASQMSEATHAQQTTMEGNGASTIPSPPARSSVFSHLFQGFSTSSYFAHEDQESPSNASAFSRAKDVRPTAANKSTSRQGAHRQLATAVDLATVAQDAKAPSFPERPSRPTTRASTQSPVARGFPPELPSMLDGSHSDDELCVKFGKSWPDLYTLMERIVAPPLVKGATDDSLHGQAPDTRPRPDMGLGAAPGIGPKSHSRNSQNFPYASSNYSDLYETTESTPMGDKSSGQKQLAVIAI
ncbi:Nitrogen permease regulator 2 [Malassezia equina]|uniref:Nitrogen permease regulator 2 n=1 Tax=Malassezia equina TaxID=1381935 RepID=A0AAF0EDT6_9BASI|nr:Nitrogen permease regulator 2 [Malassezia equina]